MKYKGYTIGGSDIKSNIKGVEKRPSPFDTFINLVKFEVLQRIFEFGPKKRYESDLTDSKIS